MITTLTHTATRWLWNYNSTAGKNSNFMQFWFSATSLRWFTFLSLANHACKVLSVLVTINSDKFYLLIIVHFMIVNDKIDDNLHVCYSWHTFFPNCFSISRLHGSSKSFVFSPKSPIKTPLNEWTHAVQTPVAQRSTVGCNFQLF